MRDWLSHRVAAGRDDPALIRAEDGETWTYGDLDRLVAETAGRLAAHGVSEGDHLGVLLEPSVGYVGLIHASMRLGATLVPLGSRLTPRELRARVERAEPTFIVCGSETETKALAAVTGDIGNNGSNLTESVSPTEDAIDEYAIDGRVIGGPGASKETGGNHAESLDDESRDTESLDDESRDTATLDDESRDTATLDDESRDTATLDDESRDTGPLDVTILSVDEAEDDRVDVVYGPEPISIDPPEWDLEDRLCLLFTSGTTGQPKAVEVTAGNVLSSAIGSAFRLGVSPGDRWLVTLSLHHMGGLAPVYRSTLYGTTVVIRESFDPGGAADDIDAYDITGVSLVPTMLKRMLDSRGTLADSLNVVLLGGAPAPNTLIERCENYSIPVHPTYGMTETASQIATATTGDAFDRLGTVGQPLLGTDVTIVDDAGDPVENGNTGELVVAGPMVTPGYYGDPETNTTAFGEYGLHTGDVGYRDDGGYLYVLNRSDDRIITGGENVEPGEVAAVLRDHPDVEDVAVIGLEDPDWGERVGAFVVPGGTGSELDVADLIGFARERLASFKLPQAVAIGTELPRTVSGTVDREALRDRIQEHGFDPEPTREEVDDGGIEPASPEPPAEGDSADGTLASSSDDVDDADDADGFDDADDAGGVDGANDAGGADGANDAGGADGANDAGGADGANDAEDQGARDDPDASADRNGVDSNVNPDDGPAAEPGVDSGKDDHEPSGEMNSGEPGSDGGPKGMDQGSNDDS